MTLTLYVFLLTILALVSSLLTEACKKTFTVTKPTLLVGIISVVTGWGGGVIAYILMGIAFTTVNVICLFLLAPGIWLTATLGYDKVMEVIEQIKGGIL
jgi:hypothetical protein